MPNKEMTFEQVLCMSQYRHLIEGLEARGQSGEKLVALVDELYRETGHIYKLDGARGKREAAARAAIDRLVVTQDDLRVLDRSFLAEVIADSGMTKKAIMEEAGINRVTLNLHLKGSSCMSVDYLLRIMHVLVKAPGRKVEN